MATAGGTTWLTYSITTCKHRRAINQDESRSLLGARASKFCISTWLGQRATFGTPETRSSYCTTDSLPKSRAKAIAQGTQGWTKRGDRSNTPVGTNCGRRWGTVLADARSKCTGREKNAITVTNVFGFGKPSRQGWLPGNGMHGTTRSWSGMVARPPQRCKRVDRQLWEMCLSERTLPTDQSRVRWNQSVLPGH